MDLRPRECDLVATDVTPLAEMAGDRRTGRLLGDVIGGIIGSERAEEHGLGEEIGALRFALMRVLAEEEGPRGYPGAVVVGGSRLATASARLARATRAVDEGHEPLNEAIAQILRDLDGERGG